MDPRLAELTRSISSLPKGTAFTRLVQCLARAKGSLLDAELYAQEYRDTPAVAAVLRSAVQEGSTTTWGANLVYQTMQQEFIELLRPETILGRMSGLRTVPFNAAMQKQLGGASVYWVSEATAKPLSALSFDTATALPFFKLASIIVLTDELMRFSTPAAEQVVRRELLAAVAQFQDQQFIDPTIAASPGTSPGAITNGATAISSTGSSVAQITTDVKALLAAAINAGVSFSTGVWVMHPRTALHLSTALTAGNSRMWPEIGARGGQWFGLPVIVSANVPIDTGNDSYIALIDASEVFYAEGPLLIDVSKHAALEMEDAPRGGAQNLVSLWQNNLTAIRAERTINWQRRNDLGVAVIEDVSY